MQRQIIKIKSIKEIVEKGDQEVWFKVRKRPDNHQWIQLAQTNKIKKLNQHDDLVHQIASLDINEPQNQNLFLKKVDYGSLLYRQREKWSNDLRTQKNNQTLWKNRYDHGYSDKDILIFKENDDQFSLDDQMHDYDYYKVQQSQPDHTVHAIIDINDYQQHLHQYDLLEDKQIMQLYEDQDSNSENYYANDYPDEEDHDDDDYDDDYDDEDNQYNSQQSSQSSQSLDRFRKEFENAIQRSKLQQIDSSF